jgi:prepilin-type N-terminal cleavage/methylation domain-containing protein
MRKTIDDSGLWQSGGNHQAGFSLLEVMICMVILTVAISMFAAVIAQNVRLEAMNAETNVALSAAQSVIEDVHTMTYAEISSATVPATFVAQGAANDGQTMLLTSASGSTQVGSVSVTEDAGQTKKTVEVTVTWRSATGGTRSLFLMTEATNY